MSQRTGSRYGIQSAPVCETQEESDVTYTWTGLTVRGQTIDVLVTGSDSESDVTTGTLLVFIGPDQIFSGLVQGVLDQQMLATG
jgi:hypothetical protein